MSVMSELKFYLMHFMPYPDIAPNMPNGQWVDIPNTRFDAKVGHKLYQEYLDELVLGDELGCRHQNDHDSGQDLDLDTGRCKEGFRELGTKEGGV